MTRIRNVGGKIIETTGGKEISYAKESIVFNAVKEISFTANDGTFLGDNPKEAPASKNLEFDIDFELDKEEKTLVPFGILDFKNKKENPFFSFKYTLKKGNVDSLNFKITDDKDEIIYQMGYLKPVIIQAKKKPLVLFEAKKPTEGPLISKTWDYLKMFEPYALSEPDYTKVGEYHLNWDGFDNNEIYDSTRFDGKKLRAQITATQGDKVKTKEIEFEVLYDQVDWVDVKIDKKTKRIDVSLRVNLTDGGENGLKSTLINANDVYRIPARRISDWDRVPASVIKPTEPVIQLRTKTFEELKKIALTGLEKYWGRNKNNIVGKNVHISEAYEVYIKAIDTSKNALHALPLVYNTNGDWMRSGNPGGAYSDGNLDDDLLNVLPDLGIIQRLSYNVGYIKHDWENDPDNGWRYHLENDVNTAYDAISSFKETAAHEIGHELLQAYAGTVFSWQHKGSSYYLPQDTKPIKGTETTWDKISHFDEMPETSGEYYPKYGEIDLMKYYNSYDKNSKFVSGPDLNRTIAAEKDVLSLIWLTKIKIK